MSVTMWFEKIMALIELIILRIKWMIMNFSKAESDSMTCLIGKTAIVTGGNSGIGYATSLLLASRGCKVIIACRREAKDVRNKIISLTGNRNICVKYLDLSKLETVRSFVDDIKKTESKIDILVNNAGIGATSAKSTEDGLNVIMQTNYFGSFLLTHLLVDLLKCSGKANVVFTASVTIFFHKFKFIDLNTIVDPTTCLSAQELISIYTNSKLCNVLAAQMFGAKLKKYGIVVNAADPGVVLTPIFDVSRRAAESRPSRGGVMIMEIVKKLLGTDEFIGAQTTFHLATSKNLETGGLYFRCKPFPKPSVLKDSELCQNIWNKSEHLVHLKPNELLI